MKKLGELAESALEKAEKENSSSIEFKRRVAELLDSARTSAMSPLKGEELQQMRGVELLERIGSSEARNLLKKLAGGTPSARLTHEAKASLRRLEARSQP